MTKPTPDYDHAYEVITHAAAEAAAASTELTPDAQRFVVETRAVVAERLAELRRQRLPHARPIRKARPIHASLVAMARDALVARFDALADLWGAQLQVAHRDLDTMSDDDLRRLVQRLDPGLREG